MPAKSSTEARAEPGTSLRSSSPSGVSAKAPSSFSAEHARRSRAGAARGAAPPRPCRSSRPARRRRAARRASRSASAELGREVQRAGHVVADRELVEDRAGRKRCGCSSRAPFEGSMLGALAARDEDRLARLEHACGVPGAARHHERRAAAERARCARCRPSSTTKSIAPESWKHELVAGRMALPARPVLGEAIGADQPPAVRGRCARLELLPEVGRHLEQRRGRAVGQVHEGRRADRRRSSRGSSCLHVRAARSAGRPTRGRSCW